MSEVEAIREVDGFLSDGNIPGAQAAVVASEAEGSVLPSNVFERVLREAVRHNAVLPFYAEFCQRAYGKTVFANMIWEMVQ